MFFDIWHMSMFGPLEFIIAGVLVGFCVGITGVGGGSLMTPILINLSSMKYFSFLASFGKLAYLDLSNKPL